ncbi:unnamed protein product [Gongylonema pulchrum]|uniref:PH_RBD domain-containing protein n=1 Tax=Gongylonema pulchrum TaxID=637853 RepID=A0A183E2C8_9BILA|nr:unnamed protein product [Gongylonema pulchrum]
MTHGSRQQWLPHEPELGSAVQIWHSRSNSSLQMRKGAAAATVFVKDDERMFHVKDDPVSYGRSKLASYEDSKEESAIVFEKPLATTSHSDAFNVVGLVHDAITLARILKR